MKLISFNLPDDSFEAIEEVARSRQQRAEDVARDIVLHWSRRKAKPERSILSFEPVNLGAMTVPAKGDLLGEMLDDSWD